jgi:peptide/nickel transport system substrate-binding protein
MTSGEMDCWEAPTGDLLPLLERQRHLKRELVYDAGTAPFCRFNHLYPPFDNPAIRRALLPAIGQESAMIAAMGDDPSMRKVPCGFFPPGSPMASNEGMDNILPQPDYDRARRELKAAGYKGETVALMAVTDIPTTKAISDVVADAMRHAGLTADYQALDFGTLAQRRASKKPRSEGGWNALCTIPSAVDFFTPATHYMLRGNGENAYFGWPTSPRLEELRDAWFDAPDLAGQKKIAAEMQAQAFVDVPYIPLGVFYNPSVYRRDVTDILHGFPIFWNMRRA